MSCRIAELRNKEVINMRDGGRIGFVSDVELNPQTAALTAIVIYGRLRLFGLLGREPDTVIPWQSIHLIGGDTVLVDFELPQSRTPGTLWQRFLEKLQ